MRPSSPSGTSTTRGGPLPPGGRLSLAAFSTAPTTASHAQSHVASSISRQACWSAMSGEDSAFRRALRYWPAMLPSPVRSRGSGIQPTVPVLLTSTAIPVAIPPPCSCCGSR
jgi:hypothetical protein